MSFRGSIAALPTPFVSRSEPASDDGHAEIDFGALRRLIERQIANGTEGLVVNGSTGEAPALSREERLALLEFAVGVARGRVPVLAGLGAGATRLACDLARESERRGADGLLATTPAYSRPTQEGLAAHFRAIAESTSLPVVLYNIPSRTGIDLRPETVRAIVEENRTVVAIKESSDDVERLKEIRALGTIDLFCGEDRLIVDAMELGAVGAISVVSNLAPRRVARLVHAFDDGNAHAETAEILEPLRPLIRALGLESNPAPLKTALELMGQCGGQVRLPLVRVRQETRNVLAQALEAASLPVERE